MEYWVCPLCKHEQQIGTFEWCGKNLKCQGCGDYWYYKEWSVHE